MSGTFFGSITPFRILDKEISLTKGIKIRGINLSMSKKANKNRKRLSKKTSAMVMSFAALGVIGVGGLGVSAMNQGGNSDELASKLASKFSLNEAEVSKELDAIKEEQKAQHQAERAAELSERLQAKVDDGTITAEQKTLLEQKLEENQAAREAEREANKDSDSKPSKEEMEAKREEHKTEMENWLSENNINLSLDDIKPEKDGGRHRGGPRE